MRSVPSWWRGLGGLLPLICPTRQESILILRSLVRENRIDGLPVVLGDTLPVAPAQAGAHNHECAWTHARLELQPVSTTEIGGYGSRLSPAFAETTSHMWRGP